MSAEGGRTHSLGCLGIHPPLHSTMVNAAGMGAEPHPRPICCHDVVILKTAVEEVSKTREGPSHRGGWAHGQEPKGSSWG